ncbi:MAG: hypothetical protein A3C47_02160 [Omnitrophica bacterium RIFCSPHIGHO2_02_FULL_51_18]|nr:MAG: hypothetical protein A3C47_02160 [Omnitrophica bacterium RIFCSPHIGHO2_02_FULL_51_18]
MQEAVITNSGIKISIRHTRVLKNTSIVIAPGFFQSKETKTFHKLENELLEYFDVVSMDFRGHGKSEGLYTFSAYEKEDLKAVIDYSRQHYKKVGVLGFSYGGSIAILEQVEYRNIDSMICVSSPMASDKIEFKWWTPDAIKLGIRGLELGAGVRPGNIFLRKTKPIDVVSSVSPIPIYFIHGTHDPTVSLKHSEYLYKKAKEPKKVKIFENGSHAEEIYRQFPDRFVEEIRNWFSETLES